MTLYGLVDLGVAQSKDTATLNGVSASIKKSEMTSMINGPRIGFKGTEDLGGGLKANFLMEYGVQPDDGAASTTMNNRQSFVGVEGGFGTVNLGRQYTAYHAHQGAFDMVNGNTNTLVGPVVCYTTRVSASNAMLYTTPSFSGVTATVMYGFGETAKTAAGTKKNDSTGLNVKYANGPLTLGVGYDSVKNPDTATSTTVDNASLINWSPVTGASATNKGDGLAGQNGSEKLNVYNLAASYDLGVAKIAGQYFDLKETKYAGTAGVSAKLNGFNLGVSVPMGAITLAASYSKADVDVDAAGLSANVAEIKGHQFLATYALSKRSTVYAAYGQDKLSTSGVISSFGANADVKRQQYGVGLRHTF